MTLAIAKQKTKPVQPDKALATRFFLSLPSGDIFKKPAANDRARATRSFLSLPPVAVFNNPSVNNVGEGHTRIGKSLPSDEQLNRIATTWEKTLIAEKAVAKPRVLDPMPVVAKGSTPCETLMSACRNGDLLVLDQLVRQGVNLDYKDKNFNTALCIAAEHGHKHCASVLTKRTRTLNQRGQFKRTPIHIAAVNGHQEVVHLLAMKGARLNVKDSKGSHCLDALPPEFIMQLRADMQQALNHLDSSREHLALCKRFRSSIRSIDKFCQTRSGRRV